MIIVNRNPTEPPADPPLTTTGRLYRYELTYDDDHRRAYADTLTELCGALIEGYDPEEITERLATQNVSDDHIEALVTGELDELRIVHTVGIQVRLQANINVQEPIESLTAAQQSVLRGTRVDQPAIDHWDVDVPIVLSAHDYEPYGPLPRPEGNIIWLDPRDESTFLESLETAGLIRVVQSSDFNPEEDTTADG